MRVSGLQRPASSTYGTKFIHCVIKSSKTRVGVLLFLSVAFGFWIRPQGYHWPILRWVETHVNERYIKRYAQSLTTAPRLPTLHIDVKFKHVEKLRRKREEALKIGILLASDDDFVPAKLHFEGRTIPATLRLRGNLTDHLEGSKWSFRIKTKGDHHVLGMRRFSIHHPKVRGYLYEWGFLKSLRQEGVLAPRYPFINVFFNGEDRGIFALEERFAEELLASQERREGVIIKPDESELWVDVAQLNGLHQFQTGLRWGEITDFHLDTFRSTHVESDPLLARQCDEAIGLLRAFQEGRRKPSEVFDVEIMSRYMVLVDLWAADHAAGWANIRYYYNPITARLEPIGYNGYHRGHSPSTELLWNKSWRAMFLQDPIMAAAYVRELQRVNEPSYLDALEQQIGEEMLTSLTALSCEFGLDEMLKLPWSDLKERQAFIRRVLSPNRMVLAFTAEISVAEMGQHTSDLIEVRNVLDLPVEVVGLQVNEGPVIPTQSVWMAQPDDPAVAASDQMVLLPVAEKDTPPQYTHFVVSPSDRSSPDGSDSRVVYVHTRLIGHERVIRTPVLYQPQAVTTTHYNERITVDQALARHEFLEQRDTPGDLWIKSGAWEVHQDLVIPKGIRLRAGPDTILKFGEDVVMVAQGPVEFKAAPNLPVILEPLHSSWPGMVVMKADRPSTLAHVTIRGTRGIARRGWILTGGVTFYKSPVSIARCSFEDNQAEDSLNIIRTEFELRETRFVSCGSDAFDGDFVRGRVRGCEFKNVRADGVDVSGSEITIDQTMFDQIGDKAISVGERSTVQVRSISVSQSRFGVVSKDCSKVSVDRSTFRQVQYGLAAFVKKPEFGPAHLEGHNIRMTQVAKPSLVQVGSTMTIDGTSQPSQEVDAESFYRASAGNKPDSEDTR